ncbi:MULTISPECIES: tetratricopeptide repeat protein [Bradyrhizobium]|uniref:Tetratricopeptide repeat protein n=1 Tax=Bradyrhizobium arachidis TaxID=858423 RepID=A0AAE7NIM2_9BRAD|nr:MULTISPECIES: tetratricopeptide repeat protein [Bradyrhizobium]QOG19802.1 tetratricopeptide repeat protein [Bradyrhizobium sp. SEMIA]QOZ66231.1 tetratricopeptide repeat protein [Bradyrhizobium arachidis]UFW50857.1 tetratricopeptide repeat protein [Bradyrhizobium arachidis]SFV07810.1 Tetratricopeptide repeat-containing protein [Bradyrhizobium arachidis]
MASLFPERGLARLRQIWQQPLALALMGVALCGCSFDLGSLMPEKDKPQEAPKAAAAAESAVSAGNVTEAQAHTAKAQSLAKAGETAAALDEFNRAVGLDPYNAQALYGRALIYQGNNQHDFAIADFSAASGLNPQKVEPLLGRANSYLALGKFKEAADDLDEASEADPHNAQIWTARGQAYERLGDKAKAAASYNKAVALRPRDDTARSGLARVGG